MLVGGAKRPGVGDWLSAARNPGRRDGVIAVALLVLPWVLAWALVPHHHLDATVVTILVSVTIPLSGLWLTWAAFRNASRPGSADSGARPGISAGPGSVVADRGGTAIGQVVYQQRRGVTGKPVRLADPPPLLAGREELLVELDTRLTGGDSSGPWTVALCGLGGAGKTSVALEHAHRHLGEVGVAWQFPADDPTVLAAGFTELAAQLGARDDADTRDPVASVHGTLAAFPEQWLLIFDNAPDRAAVERFLPPAGRGRVLVTSRNPNWPPGQVLDVPVLDTGVAADFLVSRTGDADRQAALDLAGELGGLPLALEQGAAYIQASGDSLAGYQALFRQRRPEMLARGQPIGYDSKVAATWSLAFTQLEQSAPVAAGLLRLLACCAPDAIPVHLLLQPHPGLAEQLGDQVAPVLVPLLGDELVVKDAVVALRQYSLVTPAGDGLVSVHRLVQAVTLDQMPADLASQWRHATATLIEAAIPTDTDSPQTWPVCAVLLPHAQMALADDNAGTARLASYLGDRGSYAAALEFQQRIVHGLERSLGPEHPDTLAARANLAAWTGEGGDAAGARDQYAALLPVSERTYGPAQRETLIVGSNLARWMGQAGDAAGARDYYAALLPVFERVLGAEHPDTMIVRGNLATWTGLTGDAAGARDQYAALVSVDERVRGAEHPETLSSRANLASFTGNAGDATGARDQYAALLPVIERVLGPEHPNTLTTRQNLAYWTGQTGDATGARDQYAALLPLVERVLGPDHPNILAVRNNLARFTRKAEAN
jgi:hypothetical protein